MSIHGGDIYRNDVDLDFSVSLNPLGMPKEVAQALKDSVSLWSAYPDPYCGILRGELACALGVDKEAIAFGNGAAELIRYLVCALKPKKALVCEPTFSEYGAALRAAGCDITDFELSEEDDLQLNADEFAAAVSSDTDLVFICNPNNPTGQCLRTEEMRKIEKACRERQAFLCVDETFVELTEDPEEYSVLSDCEDNERLGVLRAFTKTYALAGLRLGYLICYDRELISDMDSLRQPWNVSAPAQTAGSAALTKVPASYLDEARRLTASERARMTSELRRRGFHVIEGNANFILAFSSVTDLYEKCLSRGILIRDCSDFGGLHRGYIRIGLHTREEDDRFLKVLDELE